MEEIKERHPEEFDEVKKITERHQVLVSENNKLDHRMENLDSQLKEIKDNTTRYIKDKTTDLMKLNNEITIKKNELEKIMDEKNKLKSEAEDENKKKFGKYSELAQILMAVDDIQYKCEARSKYQREELKAKNVIHHRVILTRPESDTPKNFNDPLLRVDYAKA